MAKSKGKMFCLHHCWELLEGRENWKTRNDNGSPKTVKAANSSPEMNEGGDDVDGEEMKNVSAATISAARTGRPDGRKKEKEELKREGEVEALKKRSMS